MIWFFFFVGIGLLGWTLYSTIKLFARKQIKQAFKRFGIGIGLVVVCFIGMAITAPKSQETTTQEKTTKVTKEKIKKQETEQQKADRLAKEKAAKLKAEQEKAAKLAKEKADKLKAEKAKAAELAKKKQELKQTYLKKLKPQINDVIKTYDDNWKKIWQPTMSAIGSGNTDFYTAYNNMQAIKQNYQDYRFLSLEPVKGMTKSDKKLLKTFNEKMADAFTFRCMAVDIASDAFDSGNITPSQTNKMQDYISMADQSMIEATAAFVTLEHSYGITK
ncbi:hypothetical protein COJ46_02490 [Bacillus sp. AFS077874]|uniref:hypothetical protein n=1 Tax=Bacillus sp. AFS077874 TaxID=2033513 RepID=UPI000BF66D5E|nr:hypothetical protein [Bacillus sp. AFS077874]PFM82697.1 hypothetical protein COJ46_02490 [Bacillus sp. AFS077874]